MNRLFILLLVPVTLQAQSTFTFGPVNQPRQVYPVGAPMQQAYMPMQPMPMQPQPGSRGSGIPIGPIIGLVGGLIQSAAMADRQDRMQRQAMQRQQQESSMHDKYTTCSGSSVNTAPHKKTIKNEVTADNATYDRPVVLRREPLPTGTRITHHTVKSPHSNYTISTANGASLPGHIVTDHSVVPKKNFIIPQELPMCATED